jgi:hypothetical protein
MKVRFLSVPFAVLAALALASCRTVSMRDFDGIDLAAAENEEAHSEPMKISPAVDLFDFRLPIVTIDIPQSLDEESAIGNTTTSKDSYETAKRLSAPIGIGLGNGLSIDYRGNVYIDPFVHLADATAGDYVMKSGARRLEKKGSTYRITSLMEGSVTVDASEEDITVKTGLGRSTVTISEDKAEWIPPSLLVSPKASAQVKGNRADIEIQKLFTSKISSVKQSGGFIFNDRRDTSFPSYTVKKNGDAYTIEKYNRASPETYIVYFLDKKIVVFANGRLKDVFEIEASGITMNKKPFIVIER